MKNRISTSPMARKGTSNNSQPQEAPKREKLGNDPGSLRAPANVAPYSIHQPDGTIRIVRSANVTALMENLFGEKHGLKATPLAAV